MNDPVVGADAACFFNDEDIRLHDIRIEDVYNLTNDLLNKMED